MSENAKVGFKGKSIRSNHAFDYAFDSLWRQMVFLIVDYTAQNILLHLIGTALPKQKGKNVK